MRNTVKPSLSFCDGNQVIAVLLHNGFQLLLFVAHSGCIGVDALELGYRSEPQHWHATPGLVSSEPGQIGQAWFPLGESMLTTPDSSQSKSIFWCSNGTSCVLVSACFLSSCHWAPLKRAWLHSLCTLPSGVCEHWWVTPKPSLLQAEQSQLSQPFLVGDMLHSFTIFVSLLWNLSTMSISLLYWGIWKWTQHTRCGLISFE